MLAFIIPTHRRINAVQFSREARALVNQFDRGESGDFLVLTSKRQQKALFALKHASEGVTVSVDAAKQGILAGSLLAGVGGVIILRAARHYRDEQ
jgi:hypothetical protein